MNIFTHADDLGLSRGITDNILECIDCGAISSTSIIANGYAFDYAVDEYKKRPDLRLVCHLNLVEGKPVSPPDKVNMLINNNGYLQNTFFSLWLKYLTGSKEERNVLKQQISLEISEQIERITSQVGKHIPINIDSHQHFHMIPFIFDILLELKSKYDISYIRMTEEPFFFHYSGIYCVRNYFSSNIIKHLLLNTLARRNKKLLSNTGIDYCDYFIGVLFTGKMSVPVVDSALSSIPKTGKPATVEILFHPGGASKGEEKFWADNMASMQYYFSPWRGRERKALTNSNLKKTLNELT